MFKRPAWATSSTNSNSCPTPVSTGTGPSTSLSNSTRQTKTTSTNTAEQTSTTFDSIFHHSARTHDAIIAESAARRRHKGGTEKHDGRTRTRAAESRKVSSEESRRVESEESDTENVAKGKTTIKGEGSKRGSEWTPSQLKKRRIGADDAKALLNQVGIIISDDEDEGATTKVEIQGEKDVQSDVTSSVANDNDDEEDDVQIQSVRQLIPEEDGEVDPDLLELRRKARKRDKQQETEPSEQNTVSKEAADPVVQLLITSPIPNTNPLIIVRKLSQRLQEVRLQWCQRQGFTEDFTAKVFLAFCGRRKYDVTAVKSLGLQVNDLGTVSMRNGESWEMVDRIHLEAMTEELMNKRKDENEKLQRQATAEVGAEASSAELQQRQQQQQQHHIKLLIRAKGQKDYKLKVKPDTLISKIINAAKQEFNISRETDAYVEFDGERLDPASMVKDTEIEPDEANCVEFYSA